MNDPITKVEQGFIPNKPASRLSIECFTRMSSGTGRTSIELKLTFGLLSKSIQQNSENNSFTGSLLLFYEVKS
ncbi:hypothetical protein L6452_16136 [Arctium lappa]|uniref:Uncharacterized protein n=1 Tax=Arctium lappa TaxID=4217 RepID=A0ACB9BZV3_ARCLA|nr:hypothetical protein L6452_16136 [Arctium lappa]